jgi:hypothetical protein
MEIINSELDIFLTKGSIKESVVKKNLPNLYEYLLDKDGNTISEKVFLLLNKRGICKICSSDVKFISIKRGYRTYCSRKCSNNDDELSKQKVENAKKTNLMIYGVDNPSKSDIVKKKIIDSKSIIDYKKVNKKFKKTMIEKYGVDNPSKVNNFKKKKKITTKYNWGVDNPFQSGEIKVKIKEKLLNNYGVDHPLKSKEILNSIKERNIERWGVDNYTKTKDYKELMFEKYRSGSIKTNLTINTNYVSYKGLGSHELKCDNGFDHTYITNSHLYHARNKNKNKQCLVCYPLNEISSFKEIEIYEFIKSIYDGEVIKSYRNGLEIDIYLPEYNIGFEFNGLYWHSELFKEKDYHLNKSDYFKNKGIRIIHLWEDDWDFKKEILKSQIKNWLGITENKIWARKCEVRNIEIVDEYRDFLNENHIQGYVSSSIKIGLFYNNELVSLMTFDHFEGRKKMGENEWNLSRFCNKINYNIIGGASKLLIYFIKNFNPSRIISFADRSWSDGNLYNNLGFSLVNISSPNYSYLIDKKRSNKQKWKKSNLVKMGFDKNLSESKIMEDNFGSYKIYDCGQIKFELLI